jgi:hypothetical protein
MLNPSRFSRLAGGHWTEKNCTIISRQEILASRKWTNLH